MAKVYAALIKFLSTPSGWRATYVARMPALVDRISIHALRVEGDLEVLQTFLEREVISIHALRVEGDMGGTIAARYNRLFLSTPSGWRATKVLCITCMKQTISIHALRVEGDLL